MPAPPVSAVTTTTRLAQARSRTAPTCRRCSRSSRCAGPTSAFCCRCHVRASATRRSPRSPATSSSPGSRAPGPRWRSPSRAFGSDSAAITTTAVKDGDAYILNGEKIFVTSGDRADSVVVWATLDESLGRAAIKSFLVPKSLPGIRVERLEHKPASVPPTPR
ncbi:acyl-CoA dehydrogenase family protein [Aeromicrobium sp. UC242_57]|uniref:acyl-CoA dehydrogenase family protein n=1 Tax=Aeromicrobium sp. UC242_57 TaxID=3374624 RepID=UPI00378C2756